MEKKSEDESSTLLTKIMERLLLSDGRDNDGDDDSLSSRNAKAKRTFEKLIEKYPTKDMKAVAAKEREAKSFKGTSFVYGELRFVPFACTFQKIQNDFTSSRNVKSRNFVDLGSGAGKACFAAALLHPFKKIIGIEILQDLTSTANKILREEWKPLSLSEADIEFIRADVTTIEWWKECDVAFANSTCFDRKLMQTISKQSENMERGTFFITFTKELSSECWEVLDAKRYNMSWGAATVFIHRKK